MSRTQRRFDRQFDTVARLVPALSVPLSMLRRKGWRIVRLPMAIFFILGGSLSILPVLGVWMLPFGLLLLAIDLPSLRGPISALIIRTRRRVNIWTARWRASRRQP